MNSIHYMDTQMVAPEMVTLEMVTIWSPLHGAHPLRELMG
jgi:hypothetical protein